MLTLETIDHRIELLKKQFSRFLDLSSDAFGMIVNNGDWFRDMNYLTILREIGADFTVNRMLAAECFKQRYERGLSFLEFNYMILQSYDFLHLHRKYGCSVQLGGDDQWSNMLGGADLVRRKEQAQAFAVTLPLLTTSSGAKMGKTEKGAVWLDENMTSPFEFFQYFRSIEDDMVEKCLLYFTDVPVADVTAMTSKRDHSINEAKITLAFEITKLVHGVAEAERAKDMAAALFSGSSDAAPEVMIPMDRFSTGAPILDLLVETGICETKGEARRLIEQNGISFNDQKVTDPKQIVEHAVLMSEPVVKKGKKNFYKIKLV
jgi:tyrosyl-tRNA synthetase